MTDYTYVKPYCRKDGTWVHGHKRRNPSPKTVGGGGALAFFIAAVLIVGAIWSLGHGGSTSTRGGNRPSVHQTHVTSPARQGGS